MPMPIPKQNEKKEDFISRFMGDAVMIKEYKDEDQRMAVANSQWEKLKKLSDIFMADFEPPQSGDAPKQVKDILDSAYSSCRAAWVKDHPNDTENENNKTSCAQQAWTAVKNAGWHKVKDKWKKIDRMADIREMFNQDYVSIPNVEILNQFENAHGIQFTDNDMDIILSNYQTLKDNKELIPNVKISHSDQQLIMQELFKMHDVEFGEELPNIGILENFKIKATEKGKAIYADIVKIPKVIKGIYGGLYTSLSPEIVRNWRGELGKVIRGIVLSNNPSQKHIPDVFAMSAALSYGGNPIIIEEGGKTMGKEGKDDETVQLTDDQLEKAVLENDNVIVKLADKLKEKLGFKKEPDKKAPTQSQNDDELITLSKADYDEMKNAVSEINQLKKKLIEKDEATVNLSDEVQKIKKNAQKEKAEAICSKAQNDGVPTVLVNKLKPILLSDLGEKTIKLSHMVDEEMVEADVSIEDIIKDVFENYPESGRIEMSDKTSTDVKTASDDKMKKINARTKELQTEGGMDYHTALTQAGREILG